MKTLLSPAPALLALSLLVPAATAQIPPHPAEITYPPLDFEVPLAAEYRHELSNGVPVFVAPSAEFPLVTVSFAFKGGSYLETPEQTGLASMVGTMIRRGGTMTVPAEDMDERFDFLAADVSTFVGSETSGASIDCLKSNFDEAFALFMDMLRAPGFDAERLRIQKADLIEDFKQRNDNPMSVAMPTLRRLVYGETHYTAREPTQASIEAIDPAAMRAMHARIFHPGNLIVSVTGDVEVSAILAMLDRALSGWTALERNPDPPAPDASITPGLYHARTSQQDLPQGTTLLVSRGYRRDDPDAIPLSVMNEILGGGGFTSRITNRVRSDEGLAYTAVSFFQPQVYYPGIFASFYQSKNTTVALAAKIILEEIERIRIEAVGDEELRTAKNSFIESFPERFASKDAMVGVFVNDEMTGRDPGYWTRYRDAVGAVSKDEVLRVAREYLDPGAMSMLVVGDWEQIAPGDLEGRASMEDFFGGEVTHLPMLDPLTREPIEEPDASP